MRIRSVLPNFQGESIKKIVFKAKIKGVWQSIHDYEIKLQVKLFGLRRPPSTCVRACECSVDTLTFLSWKNLENNLLSGVKP